MERADVRKKFMERVRAPERPIVIVPLNPFIEGERRRRPPKGGVEKKRYDVFGEQIAGSDIKDENVEELEELEEIPEIPEAALKEVEEEGEAEREYPEEEAQEAPAEVEEEAAEESEGEKPVEEVKKKKMREKGVIWEEKLIHPFIAELAKRKHPEEVKELLRGKKQVKPVLPAPYESIARVLHLEGEEYQVPMIVPVDAVRYVYDAEIRYAGAIKMREGPLGILVPVRNPSRKMQRVGEELPVRKFRTAYTSRPRHSKKNPYNKKFVLGDYVECPATSIVYTGLVVGKANGKIGVLSLGPPEKVFEIDVKQISSVDVHSHMPERYASAVRALEKLGIEMDKVLSEDLVSGTYVSLRAGKKPLKGIVLGFDKEGLRIGGDDGEPHFCAYAGAKKLPRKSPFLAKKVYREAVSAWDYYSLPVPSRMREALKSYFYDFVASLFSIEQRADPEQPRILKLPKKSWKEFYTENFTRWNYARLFNSLRSQVDEVELKLKAIKVAHEKLNMKDVALTVERELGVGLVSGKVSDKDILDHLRGAKRTLSIFEGMMVISFHKRYLEALPVIRGKELEAELQKLVDEYVASRTTDYSVIYKELFDREVMILFEKVVPSEEDKEAFEDENLSYLSRVWQEYDEEYETELKKYEQALKLVTSPQDVLDKTKREVAEFENVIYSTYGATVQQYLEKALLPIIFLDPSNQIGQRARFFKEKIKSGNFSISALYSANIAHFMPEFAMNLKLDDSDYEDVLRFMTIELVSRMNDFLTNFVYLEQPGVRRAELPRLPSQKRMNWDRILVRPQNVCEGGQGVSDADLVICYDDGKFVCQSIDQVLNSILYQKSKNVYTGKPFPEEFVMKMKSRYHDRLVHLDLFGEYEEANPEELAL